MNLCLFTGGKSESSAQHLGLLSAYLFLRFEHGINKLLVRNLAVKMSLGHIIVYLEFGVLKKFLSDPCPDMERRIPVVGDIEAHKFGTGRQTVTLRICLAVNWSIRFLCLSMTASFSLEYRSAASALWMAASISFW